MLEEAQWCRIHTKPEIVNQECIFCWLTNTLKVEDTCFLNLLILYDVSVNIHISCMILAEFLSFLIFLRILSRWIVGLGVGVWVVLKDLRVHRGFSDRFKWPWIYIDLTMSLFILKCTYHFPLLVPWWMTLHSFAVVSLNFPVDKYVSTESSVSP